MSTMKNRPYEEHSWLDVSTFGSQEQLFVCQDDGCLATYTKPWPHADTWEEQSLDMTTGRPEDYDHEAQAWAENQGEYPPITACPEHFSHNAKDCPVLVHTMDVMDVSSAGDDHTKYIPVMRDEGDAQ